MLSYFKNWLAHSARTARRTIGDKAGSTAVMFAVALVPMAMAIGAAVDYGSALQMRTLLTSSLDSATLSVAIGQASGALPTPTGTAAQVRTALSSEVQHALDGRLASMSSRVTTTATADTDATGAITSHATMRVNTQFMKMFGINTVTMNADSKVMVPAGPVEVAMVLDTTGSMAGAKIAGLQSAANNLASTLFSMPNASANLKVAVVPFTYYVNIGLSNRNASWLSGSSDYSVPQSGCYDTYPYAVYSNPVTVPATCTNDGIPYDCSWTNYQTVNLGAPVNVCSSWTNYYTWNGCVGSRNYPADLTDTADSGNPVPALLNYSCSTPLLRLTNSLSTVQTQINSLTAGGETYIATGLLWGWRTLSPNTPFADGASYTSRTRKYMVVMTDGANTHSPNYPDHEGTDVALANDLTAQTCAAIKAKGITIYTVAFTVTDPTIKSILQACATSTSGYFDSASVADLQAAFSAIGNSITSARIVQ